MAPDAEGFRQVQSRRRWRRVASPRRPVPSNLVGLCFNCLAGDHVHADCTFPAKCYNCRDVGHQARDCPLPPVAGRWEGKRGRSPPRATGFRRGARRRRSSPSRGASPADTVSAHSASTGREPSVPPVCQPPTPEPQVNDPPAGNAGQPLPAAGPSEVAGDAVADGPLDQPPAPELPRLIPRALLRTPELQAAEDALSMALLALLVGTRPVVTPTMVLDHLEEHFGIPDDRVSVRRTRPNDFIVRFSRREDLERVLSAAPPERAPFTLQWRRWSRLIMGLAGAFRFNSRARRDVVRKFLAQERVSVVCLWKEKNKRTSDVVVGGRHRRSDTAPGSGGVDQGWILLPCSALPLLVVAKFSSSVISVTFESSS
ncbi:unnamed protein product [Miscanthus lutarioriparius]|uniref:CCHC-type domain-containing protein n=1 Tax=Miscanthus lutarioriparius TaxID=422564 RepID=A0A811P8S1_9POAL|nr:unnamed protein product [Miscanthus lutarioriparius]